MSRTQRQRRIVELLGAYEVHSQGELSDLLVAEGTEVTQATLSRDLVELGAVKVRHGRTLVYAVPGEGGAVAGAPPPGGAPPHWGGPPPRAPPPPHPRRPPPPPGAPNLPPRANRPARR